ncbi:MAG: aldehyde dehydrogenase family protein, partial [Bacteroidota bacterium]
SITSKVSFSNSFFRVSILFDSIGDNWKAGPALAMVSASAFMESKNLREEVFGPFTIAILCRNREEVLEVGNAMHGQLTATILGTDKDVKEANDLIEVLQEKAGRLIFNGVPTGVEVCPAMHHGGPFPSTSNAIFTSVGTDAIKRFARPIAFQNMPGELLPEELQQDNPLDIWRTVNGELTKS